MFRLAMAAALALGLVLAGCASGGQTATTADGGQWSKCDRSRPNDITLICVKR
jgi:ABC-type glycerol-3-phosphate transport system substrate-binding protein